MRGCAAAPGHARRDGPRRAPRPVAEPAGVREGTALPMLSIREAAAAACPRAARRAARKAGVPGLQSRYRFPAPHVAPVDQLLSRSKRGQRGIHVCVPSARSRSPAVGPGRKRGAGGPRVRSCPGTAADRPATRCLLPANFGNERLPAQLPAAPAGARHQGGNQPRSEPGGRATGRRGTGCENRYPSGARNADTAHSRDRRREKEMRLGAGQPGRSRTKLRDFSCR